MIVIVDSGRLPAMSTIAVMSGTTPEGDRVDFKEGELVEVDVEEYLVLRVKI